MIIKAGFFISSMYHDSSHITTCNYCFLPFENPKKHIGQISRSVNAICSVATSEFAKLKQRSTV